MISVSTRDYFAENIYFFYYRWMFVHKTLLLWICNYFMLRRAASADKSRSQFWITASQCKHVHISILFWIHSGLCRRSVGLHVPKRTTPVDWPSCNNMLKHDWKKLLFYQSSSNVLTMLSQDCWANNPAIPVIFLRVYIWMKT